MVYDTIVMASNNMQSLAHFRLPLIKSLVASSRHVHILAPMDAGALALAELRDETLAACADGSCPLDVKAKLDEDLAEAEGLLERALDAVFCELDRNQDSVV